MGIFQSGSAYNMAQRHRRRLHHPDRADLQAVQGPGLPGLPLRGRQAATRRPGERSTRRRRDGDAEPAAKAAEAAAGPDDRPQRPEPAALSSAGARRPGPREAAGAAAFFLFATVFLTWPIAPRAATGLADLWDAKLNAWILHWDFHQTFRDPLHLFDANIFYPARYALAFSENLFGASLFGFPLYAAGVSTLTAYNVLFLLGVFLSAFGAWALAREITGDTAAALLAGLVYAFSPWRMSQIPHVQFQWGAFLPLLLLFLLRYLDAGRRRDLLLFAVGLAWNALCNVHYAFFSAALVAAVLGLEALTKGEIARKRIGAALLAVAVAGATVSPFFIPYARASRLYGMKRSAQEAEFFSGRVTEFLSAGVRNKLYGKATQRFSHPEGDFFPGLVPAALAVVAIRRRRRRAAPAESASANGAEEGRAAGKRRRGVLLLDLAAAALSLLFLLALLRPGLRAAGLKLSDPGRILVFASACFFARLTLAFPTRWRYRDLRDFLSRGPIEPAVARLLAVGLAGLVIALGLHTPFYRFLFQSAGFLFGAIRAPSRGIVLFQLVLGVLAAWGLSLAAKRTRGPRRAAWIAGALALTAFEYRVFPVDVAPVAARPPAVYSWLAGVEIPAGGVIEWPFGDWYDFEYEFRSTAHWKPILNGYSGFGPPSYHRLRSLLSQSPIPAEAWEEIVRLGGALVVLHPHDAPPAVLGAYTSGDPAAAPARRCGARRRFPARPGHRLRLPCRATLRSGSKRRRRIGPGPRRPSSDWCCVPASIPRRRSSSSTSRRTAGSSRRASGPGAGPWTTRASPRFASQPSSGRQTRRSPEEPGSTSRRPTPTSLAPPPRPSSFGFRRSLPALTPSS